MDLDLWERCIEAARQDSWRRGCTCGRSVRVGLLSAELSTPKVGMEHLRECPLWTDRDLGNLPPDVRADSMVVVYR